jgi:ribosomal protein S18 acetylase RimI-like enzyme
MALHVAEAYGESQQARELADPDISTLLVAVEARLVGYAQLRSGVSPACVSGDAPIELSRFYVAREWHGRGIAQALMSGVVAEAQRRRARTVWLGVWERNARARAFYAKIGFVDVGSHLFMLGNDPQTDRIMVRTLTAGPADGE